MIQPMWTPTHLRQAGLLVEHGDDGEAGAAGVLPGAVLQIGLDADGDVVEHQGKERLVGPPPGLAEGRDQAPEAACKDHSPPP